MSEDRTWTGQIRKSGYNVENLLNVNITERGTVDFNFKCEGEEYVAKFSPTGQLRNIRHKIRTKIPKIGGVVDKNPLEEGVYRDNASDDDEDS